MYGSNLTSHGLNLACIDNGKTMAAIFVILVMADIKDD